VAVASKLQSGGISIDECNAKNKEQVQMSTMKKKEGREDVFKIR